MKKSIKFTLASLALGVTSITPIIATSCQKTKTYDVIWNEEESELFDEHIFIESNHRCKKVDEKSGWSAIYTIDDGYELDKDHSMIYYEPSVSKKVYLQTYIETKIGSSGQKVLYIDGSKIKNTLKIVHLKTKLIA